MTSELVDDFLAHYGVLGMKWGVTNEPRSKLTKDEKNRFRDELGKVIDKRYLGTPKAYDTLSTKRTTVRKGTTLKRTVTSKNLNAPDRYVSTNKQDAANYRYSLSQLTPRKKYEITLKAVETLRSPSEKERVDAFIQLMDEKSIVLRNGKTITGREFLKRQGFGREVKTLDSQTLGHKVYNDMFLEAQWQNSPLNTAYFDAVRKRGYNAVVDDNDAGVLAKTPLIVLDDSGAVKRMSVSQLTAADIFEAKRSFAAPD